MIKKKPKGGGGGESAPLWIITYADMITLLLGFFVILLSFSEIKKEDDYKETLKAIRQELGMSFMPGNGPMDSSDSGIMQWLKSMFNKKPHLAMSDAEDPGMDGRHNTVTRVREGTQFTRGGRVTFAPGSTELGDLAKRNLRKFAEQARGYKHKIEIRGHAAPMEQLGSAQHQDLWDLSYARAKAVMQYLTSAEVGLPPDRVRVTAVADREPLALRAYSVEDQEPNRRAEVFEGEALVDDFTRPEPTASAQ